ncbi:putative polysaccharide biosynthesis protein [Companilactobacillus halodurans]|uniref:Polysaccharide biosynthesis protein n=1 Tax=Companilactobacillus halodurans TaxID=2584183 RepID=A0A5P0ZN00_9LACO|nr:polysaccharide biosynthesis protein [Companilactobacillus halodurans]MQS75597.1 polysaccharide biosynthesis protein [Companilactobacillus halodurans]MQS96310.1 polysaccharide biosynthesis protein [Companilactobacillus halodurans]
MPVLEPEVSSQDTMLKGSAWMTAGSIFSRILGAIYIIPWMAWMGSYYPAANALFAKGYNIYSLFLIVSTAGIPGAISKQISHYNALDQYSTGNKLFKHGLKIMTFMGVIFGAIMYFGAPVLATLFTDGDPRSIPVIKSLAVAVLIIPILSILRGYLQGYADMAPSAISQFIEQIARVVYMLIATYIIMVINKGSYINAVVQSTFAAFIGAAFAIGILVLALLKKLPKLRQLSRNGKPVTDVNERNFTKEIFEQAVPFIILDAGITFFNLYDQSTFNQFMRMFVNATGAQLDNYYSLFGFQANKLIMIIVSLSTAMAVTAVPILSGLYSKGDEGKIEGQISNTLELFFFIMIPASLGMYAVAQPLWTTFYRYDALGVLMLQFSSVISILLGLFTVLSAVLQALYRNRLAIKYFVYGFIVKVVVQLPMIAIFHEFGPLVATSIGMAVVCWLMTKELHAIYPFDTGRITRRISGIILFSLIMFVSVIFVNWVVFHFVGNTDRIISVVVLILEAGLGGIIYGYLVLKTSLADKILGSKVARIRKIFNMK